MSSDGKSRAVSRRCCCTSVCTAGCTANWQSLLHDIAATENIACGCLHCESRKTPLLFLLSSYCIPSLQTPTISAWHGAAWQCSLSDRPSSKSHRYHPISAVEYWRYQVTALGLDYASFQHSLVSWLSRKPCVCME